MRIFLEFNKDLTTLIVVIVLVSILAIAFIGLIVFLLNKFYFAKKRCHKMLNSLQSDYEYYHALLTGQDNSLIQRLEIISRTNLLYSDIHSSYFKRSKEIRDTLDTKYQEYMTELQVLLEERNIKDFKNLYKSKSNTFRQFKESVNSLNQDLTNVIKPEEDARQAALVLKETLRETKSKFNFNESRLHFVSESFDNVFNKIDKKFNQFEEYLENANYDEANEILSEIEKVRVLLDTLIDKIPNLCDVINDELPEKIKNLVEKYNDLLLDDLPLQHLNIEGNIKAINDELEKDRNKLKSLSVSGINDSIDMINQLIDKLYADFDVEIVAREEFLKVKESVLSEFSNNEKVSVKISNNMLKFRRVYIIDKEHETQLVDISKKLDDVAKDKRKLDAYIYNPIPQPYTLLLDKLNILKKGNEEFGAKVHAFSDYLLNLKVDCETAYNNNKTKYETLKVNESIIRDLKNNEISELFKPKFDECYSFLDEIAQILKTVPIDVNLVNSISTELNEKTNNLVKDVQDITTYRNLATENIVLINRDRMKFAEINNIISQAETLFKDGNYRASYEMSQTALQKLLSRNQK